MAEEAITIWNKILAVCKEKSLKLCAALQPGTSDEEIAAAEEKLGVQLPADYKAILKINNGESGFGLFTDLPKEQAECFFWDFDKFLPISEVLGAHEDWISIGEDMNEDFEENEEDFREYIDERVRVQGFHEKWVPVFPISNGDVCCLDMAPTEKGHPDQVIKVTHDEEVRDVVAANFGDFLRKYLEVLQKL